MVGRKVARLVGSRRDCWFNGKKNCHGCGSVGTVGACGFVFGAGVDAVSGVGAGSRALAVCRLGYCCKKIICRSLLWAGGGRRSEPEKKKKEKKEKGARCGGSVFRKHWAHRHGVPAKSSGPSAPAGYNKRKLRRHNDALSAAGALKTETRQN